VQQLSDEHRSFLIVHQGLVPALFNLVLNGAIAWLLFRSLSSIPLWGQTSVGGDLLITAFILPFLTCVIVSRLVGSQVRAGKLTPLAADAVPSSGWSKRSAAARGLLLGAGGLLLGAAPIVVALSLGGAEAFGVGDFVAFKAVWAGLLAAVATPLVGWWALANASREAAL
jgi:hypothetical protein